MIPMVRETCPQCQQPEDIRRTCRHCGVEYLTHRESAARVLLRAGLTVVIGAYAVLLLFLAAATGVYYVVFPVLSLIFRV